MSHVCSPFLLSHFFLSSCVFVWALVNIFFGDRCVFLIVECRMKMKFSYTIRLIRTNRVLYYLVVVMQNSGIFCRRWVMVTSMLHSDCRSFVFALSYPFKQKISIYYNTLKITARYRAWRRWCCCIRIINGSCIHFYGRLSLLFILFFLLIAS